MQFEREIFILYDEYGILPAGRCVCMRFDGFRHLLAHWAERQPDAPALRFGAQSCSFGELLHRVEQRSAQLRAEGNTCMGILSDGSLDCVIEIFAANAAGLQAVLLDEQLPEDVLRGLIRYADIDRLWGDEDLVQELTPALTGGTADGAGKLLFFTSGTTEQSKAVVLTDHSLCQSAWNGSQMLPLSREDTLLCLLPLGHVFGFVCGLLWGLSNGACVALGRGVRHYFDDCAFYSPTAVSVVPLLLEHLLRADALGPTLRTVLVGAGDCPAPLLAAAAARGLRISFGYGLTETSSGVAISTGGDPFAMDICPDDTVTLAPDGEILIEAPTCMMQGYYKRPDATAAVLQDGVLHTGDLGRFDQEGRLHILGRKKDVLVLPDGTKLYLPEYESEIAEALGIRDLAVTLRSGRPILLLHGEISPAEAVQKLRPLMARRPRGQQLTDVLVTNQPLPRTATGKIKRWELQQKVSVL